MSSVAFGALTTRREISDSGTSKSDQPPALNSYIDILAALVPAEVLAINALIITLVTARNSGGQTQITDLATLRLAFWLLAGLSMALFVLGRQPAPASAAPSAGTQQPGTKARAWQHVEWQDLIRVLIPPAAFVGWTMIEPTSAWNAVAAGMSGGTRLLIATAGAVFLAAVTKALVSHSDNKLSPAEQQAAQQASTDQAPPEAVTTAETATQQAVPPQAGPSQTGPPQGVSSQAGSPQAGSSQARPSQTGPSQGMPSQAGSPQAGPSQAGPPQAGSPQAGSSQAGSSQAGPPDTGQPADDHQEPVPGTTAAAPPPAVNGVAAADESSVPKWVY